MKLGGRGKLDTRSTCAITIKEQLGIGEGCRGQGRGRGACVGGLVLVLVLVQALTSDCIYCASTHSRRLAFTSFLGWDARGESHSFAPDFCLTHPRARGTDYPNSTQQQARPVFCSSPRFSKLTDRDTKTIQFLKRMFLKIIKSLTDAPSTFGEPTIC